MESISSSVEHNLLTTIINNCFNDLPIELVRIIEQYLPIQDTKVFFTLSRSLYSMMSSIGDMENDGYSRMAKKLGTNYCRLIEYLVTRDFKEFLVVDDEVVDGFVFIKYPNHGEMIFTIKNSKCNLVQEGLLSSDFYICDDTKTVAPRTNTYGKVTNGIHTIKFKGSTSSIKNNLTKRRVDKPGNLSYFSKSISSMADEVYDTIDHIIIKHVGMNYIQIDLPSTRD